MSLTTEQHERRSQGIGGSDAAAACGMSPWKTAYDVWAEKTGRLKPTVETAPMHWGTVLEPAIRDEYQRRHPDSVVMPPMEAYNVELVWQLANVDGMIQDPFRGVGGLEIKTANPHTKDQWDTEPPVHYQVQCQHYMDVLGVDWFDLAVLIGGSDYREYQVLRDDDFIGRMRQAEAALWGFVQTDIPPDVAASASTLRELFPEHKPGSVTVLPASTVELLAEREAHKHAMKVGKETVERIDAQVKTWMGEAETGYIEGASDTPITWKTSDRAGYTVAPSRVRTLHVPAMSKLIKEDA